MTEPFCVDLQVLRDAAGRMASLRSGLSCTTVGAPLTAAAAELPRSQTATALARLEPRLSAVQVVVLDTLGERADALTRSAEGYAREDAAGACRIEHSGSTPTPSGRPR